MSRPSGNLQRSRPGKRAASHEPGLRRLPLRRLLVVILAALTLAGLFTTAAVAAPRRAPAGSAGPAGAGAPWGRNAAGAEVAETLGGSYAVDVSTNPPNCTGNASSLQFLDGGRS
jgi:hypothetical protein